MNNKKKIVQRVIADSEYMTRAQVAALLHVCPDTISFMVKDGKLGYIQFGKFMLFKRADVLKFLDSHYTPAKPKV